jgi:hypothetical protein
MSRPLNAYATPTPAPIGSPHADRNGGRCSYPALTAIIALGGGDIVLASSTREVGQVSCVVYLSLYDCLYVISRWLMLSLVCVELGRSAFIAFIILRDGSDQGASRDIRHHLLIQGLPSRMKQ